MNKQELVKAISVESGMTQDKVRTVLEAFTASITKALVDGEKVQLAGFGSWESKKKAARKGRNPKTGEEISIPEKNSVKFKASSSLNDSL